MSKFFSNEFVTLYNCDSREIPIPDETVDCVVTSPPYWGLRDYGTGNQIGLEKSPEEYVNTMVEVFREVWRVLKPTGTVWLNLGDSYNSKQASNKTWGSGVGANKHYQKHTIPNKRNVSKNFKYKDLIGIPWRVALALQADGWYLRSDIIWHKPNPMPESVKDRPTKSHEYIFLLTKNSKYYYDADAIREPMSKSTKARDKNGFSGAFKGQMRGSPNESRWQDGRPIDTPTFYSEQGRNKRSVWTVTTKPYKGAHFATFPEDLIEPCILAGCPQDGIVLDPFVGSGTTASVALKFGRKSIGVDLNKEYLELAVKRITSTQAKLI